MSSLHPSPDHRAWLIVLLALFGGSVHGQTLGDLVDRTKLSKVGGASKIPAASTTLPASADSVRSSRPLLWSLSGVDNDIQATVIYRRKVIVVDANDPATWRIGPWTVSEISTEGLEITSGKGRSRQKVWIAPPGMGASTQPYLQQLSTNSYVAGLPSGSPIPSAFAVDGTAMSAPQAIASQLPGAAPVTSLPPNNLNTTPP